MALTLLRVPIAAIFAILLICCPDTPERLGLYRIAIGVLLLGLIEVTDVMDGFLARRWGVVTEWGAMLDPYADSTARLVVYWTLAVSGLASVLVPLVMALRDITVAYCRVTLTRGGQSVSAKLSGKIKAVVQGAAAFGLVTGPLYWNHTGLWPKTIFSAIVILVTAISVAEYLIAAIKSSIPQKTDNSL